MDYYDVTIIKSGDSELYEEHHLYIGKVIPNRVIKNKMFFKLHF